MKYYLLSILTRCGEFEFSQPVAIDVNPKGNLEVKTMKIVRAWYPDDLDYVDQENVAWFVNGNAVCCDRATEITEEEYVIFQKYAI